MQRDKPMFSRLNSQTFTQTYTPCLQSWNDTVRWQVSREPPRPTRADVNWIPNQGVIQNGVCSCRRQSDGNHDESTTGKTIWWLVWSILWQVIREVFKIETILLVRVLFVQKIKSHCFGALESFVGINIYKLFNTAACFILEWLTISYQMN